MRLKVHTKATPSGKLAAFVKTDCLKPRESQLVTMHFVKK